MGKQSREFELQKLKCSSSSEENVSVAEQDTSEIRTDLKDIFSCFHPKEDDMCLILFERQMKILKFPGKYVDDLSCRNPAK